MTVDYTSEDENGETLSDTLILHISRDRAAAEETDSSGTDGEDTEEEEITAYARVGESQIVYQISGDDYKALTAASYDDLRHREVLWADFADITQLDIAGGRGLYHHSPGGSG